MYALLFSHIQSVLMMKMMMMMVGGGEEEQAPTNKTMHSTGCESGQAEETSWDFAIVCEADVANFRAPQQIPQQNLHVI